MQTLSSLITSSAIAQNWRRLPSTVKAGTVAGVLIFTGSEITTTFNHALYSRSESGGKGAQGDALASNPVAVRQDLNTGKPVPAATAQQTVMYEKESALAQQAAAEALAATESEETLLAKKAKRIQLNLAEQLKLKEFELKRQDLRLRETETYIKQQQASAAAAQARADREGAELGARMIESLQRGDGDIFKTMIDMLAPKGTFGK